MTPQTLTPAEQDELTALEAKAFCAPWVARSFAIECPCPNGQHCGDLHTCEEVDAPEEYPWSKESPAKDGASPQGQCIVQIDVPGLEDFAKANAALIAAMRNKLPTLLSMARRLGELQYRWGEFSASNLANLHSLNTQLTAATARVAELDAALTTALADAEMAEHAHDACEEQLTAATARAEAEAMAFRIVADRITEIADDALGLQVPGTAPVAMLDALEKAYHGERVAKSTADARAQAAEKRCGEMEAKLAECSQGWRRTERGDGDVRLECLTCGTVEYDALPAKPGGGK